MKIKNKLGHLVDREEMSLSDYFESEEGRAEAKEFFAKLSVSQKEALMYNFNFKARPKQKAPPGDWDIWVIHAGRGFGKTYAGASWVKQQVELAEKEGRAKDFVVGILGNVYEDDVVETQIKAIMDLYPPDQRPKYNGNSHKLVWKNGAIGYAIAVGQVPEKLRGKNLNIAWLDELVKFQYPEEAWKQTTLCVRAKSKNTSIKTKTKILITTTPKRGRPANKILKDIKADKYGESVFTTGSIHENPHNDDGWANKIINMYKGTSTSSQELEGVILDEDTAGYLWNHAMFKYKEQFEEQELSKFKTSDRAAPIVASYFANYLKNEMKQIIVAVDPAGTANAHSNETGIIVAGRNHFDQGFVFEDRSGKYSPEGWARESVALFNKYNCKYIVGENNYGGDMVRSVIHSCDPEVPVELVRATKGKLLRAEPVARLYEQGKIFHYVKENTGTFKILEHQMCNYNGNPPEKSQMDDSVSTSPDRMDALVWALSFLFSDLFKVPARGVIPFRINPFQSSGYNLMRNFR